VNVRCGTYDDLAGEYYDATLHPTAANFRKASALVLDEWLDDLDRLPQGAIVEVGAGRSLLCEAFEERGLPLGDILLTDASEAMLAASQRWQQRGARLMVADASDLPVADGSVALLVSILGDPYNSESFWEEVERALRPAGTCLFTTPSHHWSETFRDLVHEPAECAEFVVREERIRVPSYIFPHDVQQRLIERGRLRVIQVTDVPLAALGEGRVSDKLSMPLERDEPVVTGYLARRT
jgi:SAM-dependent methyltransferase